MREALRHAPATDAKERPAAQRVVLGPGRSAASGWASERCDDYRRMPVLERPLDRLVAQAAVAARVPDGRAAGAL
ncbi:MAG TPA: hypothetical protein VN960_09655 [Gaiellaceae bacterium]|nr:hypothetical protein [Gaiellaceae bacterium]